MGFPLALIATAGAGDEKLGELGADPKLGLAAGADPKLGVGFGAPKLGVAGIVLPALSFNFSCVLPNAAIPSTAPIAI